MTTAHIPPVIVPARLWSEAVLKMPPYVVSDYIEELKRLGRYDEACGTSPKKVAGGVDEASTARHFAHRFAASSVRTEYLFLDPSHTLDSIAADLRKSLSGGRVAILDVPSGAGGGILGLLAVLAFLREADILPRLPLDLAITAGDFSCHAIDLYCRMLQRAEPWLNDQGIRVNCQTDHWNALELESTARIVDRWFKQSNGCEEHIVLVAAFSADAGKQFEQYSASFEQIRARLYDRAATMLWVEPGTGDGVKFLQRVQSLFARSVGKWVRLTDGHDATFRWLHPLKDGVFSGHIKVIRYTPWSQPL